MKLLPFLFIFLSLLAHAADKNAPKGFSNETALGYVVTGGNSQSETTTFREKFEYEWRKDILKFTGHYLQASGLDPQSNVSNTTAENWAAKLRFEKIINPKRFNFYVSYGWYGDRFQGVREGQETDFGGKYYFYKKKSFSFHTELGYRYTRELLLAVPTTPVGVGSDIMPEYHYLRTYWEAEYKYNKSFSIGAWIEFLPSVTEFTQDQRINYSPYITSTLTDIFSLKVAYEARYRFPAAVEGNKLTDFTFTTSLLAKF